MTTALVLESTHYQELVARSIQTALWHSSRTAYSYVEQQTLIQILLDIRANTAFEIDAWLLDLARNTLGMKVE